MPPLLQDIGKQMNTIEFRNKVTMVNAKFDMMISKLKKDILACEQVAASIGTPVPGKLAPAMSAKQTVEMRSAQRKLQPLVKKYNEAKKRWLEELISIPSPTQKVGLKQMIPWPNHVPEKGKDFIIRCIDQGGVPITDSVTLKKMPGTWSGAMLQWDF